MVRVKSCRSVTANIDLFLLLAFFPPLKCVFVFVSGPFECFESNLILIMAFSLIPILSILKIMESMSFATYVLSTSSVKNMLNYCDCLATKYLKLSCEIV